MKTNTYLIIFKTGRFEIIEEFTIEKAKILAQAGQIKEGNDYNIMSIFMVKDAQIMFSLLDDEENE